jgi:signal transduction histidine kinase
MKGMTASRSGTPYARPRHQAVGRHDERRDADGFVVVHVDDNGIGIAADKRDAVFDNFHRAHRFAGYPGCGLGLTICKRIVERHGGTVSAGDSPDHAGTRITFTLPS